MRTPPSALAAALTAAAALAPMAAQPALAREYVTQVDPGGAPQVSGAAGITRSPDYGNLRAFSPAVITRGGRVLWLSGQTTGVDRATGRSLAGDFEGQVRDVFARIERTLQQGGATMKDIVTMTVYITDVRNGTRFTEIRRELFQSDFPASTLVTVSALAQPAFMVEVQVTAVVEDR